MADAKFFSNSLFEGSSNRVGLQFLQEKEVRSGQLDRFLHGRRASFVRGGPPVQAADSPKQQGRELVAARNEREQARQAAKAAKRQRVRQASAQLKATLEKLQYSRDAGSGRVMVTAAGTGGLATRALARATSAVGARRQRPQGCGGARDRPGTAGSMGSSVGSSVGSMGSMGSFSSSNSRSRPGGAMAGTRQCGASRAGQRAGKKALLPLNKRRVTPELLRAAERLNEYLQHREIRCIDLVRWAEVKNHNVKPSRSEGSGFMSYLTNLCAEREPHFCAAKLRGLLLGDLAKMPGMRSRDIEAIVAHVETEWGSVDFKTLEALIKKVHRAHAPQDPMMRLAAVVRADPSSDILWRNSGTAYRQVVNPAAAASGTFSQQGLHKRRASRAPLTAALAQIDGVLRARRLHVAEMFPEVAALGQRPRHLRSRHLCTIISEQECWRTNAFQNTLLAADGAPPDAASCTAAQVQSVQQQGWVSSSAFRAKLRELLGGAGASACELAVAHFERAGGRVDIFEVDRVLKQVREQAQRDDLKQAKAIARREQSRTVGVVPFEPRPLLGRPVN